MITVDARSRHLGMFSNLEDAIAAREAAEQELVTALRGKPHKDGTRASAFAMQARYADLFDIIEHIEPASVRQVFYQAVVRALVDKSENGYERVQEALLRMRRVGDIPYGWIADSTRWRLKPSSYKSIGEALDQLATRYRKSLWEDIDAYVEIWLEKDALSGVVYPITGEYDVGLHVARGFSSETFLYATAEAIETVGKPTFIYHLGDHDPSGRAAGASIEEALRRLAPDASIHFERLGVTEAQIRQYSLPLRPTKKSDKRAEKFTERYGEGSVELDALHPDVLRSLVRSAIERHMDAATLRRLQAFETQERAQLVNFAKRRKR
jgi:hypothetical protein